MIKVSQLGVINVKKLFIVAVFLLFMTGCSSVMRVVGYGSAANDAAVESSIFTICSGASVGAIRREFYTPEKLETWQRLCKDAL